MKNYNNQKFWDEDDAQRAFLSTNFNKDIIKQKSKGKRKATNYTIFPKIKGGACFSPIVNKAIKTIISEWKQFQQACGHDTNVEEFVIFIKWNSKQNVREQLTSLLYEQGKNSIILARCLIHFLRSSFFEQYVKGEDKIFEKHVPLYRQCGLYIAQCIEKYLNEGPLKNKQQQEKSSSIASGLDLKEKSQVNLQEPEKKELINLQSQIEIVQIKTLPPSEKIKKFEEEGEKEKMNNQIVLIKNLGNTCYLSAVLQCFYSTSIMRDLFANIGVQAPRPRMLQTILVLIKQFLQHRNITFCPGRIFSWLCNQYSIYDRRQQQDSGEALRQLLDGLLIDQQSSMRKKKLQVLGKWQKSTVTGKIFGYYLPSRKECLGCKKVSWKIDFSMEIALGLSKKDYKPFNLPFGFVPKEEIDEDGLVYPMFIKSESILDNFFMPEQVLWKCFECKSKKAMRKYYLKDPPLVLILTLKRYSNNLSKKYDQVKIDERLELDGICLNPGQHTYLLYAMIFHAGAAMAGHYTACCKRGQVWIQFSDDSTRIGSWQQLSKNSQPYILFYRRIQ